MIKFIKNIFKQKEYCPHGWQITDPNKLPFKRTSARISVCKDCAMKSALKEFGDGMILDIETENELREMIKKENMQITKGKQ